MSWRTWLSSWRIVEETGASAASAAGDALLLSAYLALVVLHRLLVGRDRLLLCDTGALRGGECDAETRRRTETVGGDDAEDVARVRRQPDTCAVTVV